MQLRPHLHVPSYLGYCQFLEHSCVFFLWDLLQFGLGRQTKQLVVGKVVVIFIRVQPLLPQELLQLDTMVEYSLKQSLEVYINLGIGRGLSGLC